MVRSEDELTDYQLREEQIRKVLHEPVGPYVVSGYSTVLHLVEGLVLAALFYVITIQPQITPLMVCNIIIFLGIVIAWWYNVSTNTQYGSAIRASVLNTLFPIILGAIQVALAYAISLPIYIFTLLLIPLFIMTMIHTWDHVKKHKEPQALEIWKGHYKEIGPQFTQDFFSEFRRFEKDLINKVFYVIILTGVLTLFNYFFPLSLEIKGYISFIIIGILIIMMLHFDLNYFFNNSEKLQKYGIKW